MALWHFTTPTVSEGPFAWDFMLERFRMDRGVTVKQTAPGANYILVRYQSYTDENGSANIPINEPGTTPTGLNTFRGGYDWIVDDTTKADLINSGIGITNANFTPA
jgi:hypothetical protein